MERERELLSVGIYSGRPAGDTALRFLLGDGLPQVPRLLVPLVVGGLASRFLKDGRAAVRKALGGGTTKT